MATPEPHASRDRVPADALARTALHAFAGLLSAPLVAALDVLLMDRFYEAFEADAAAVVPVLLRLWALYLPPCLVAGGLVGLGSVWVSRASFGRRTGWWRAAPGAFRAIASAACGVSLLAVILVLDVGHLVRRYHDRDLLALAVVLRSMFWMVVVAGATRLLWRALEPVAARLGRLASPGSAVALGVLCFGAVCAWVVARHPEVLVALVLRDVLFAGGTALVLSCVAFGLSRVPAIRGRPGVLSVVLVLGALAIAFGGGRYGQSQRVRSKIVQHSTVGLSLSRAYSRWTDFDGDGYSRWFGSTDCDDGDPAIHPGAVDTPGDGVDSNCFAGDDDPEIGRLAKGDFEAPPQGLDKPNFLLMTVDALRPDHLHAYGYRRDTSPHIDALAADAVRFDRAFAQSSRSIRSIPSMFTGFHPSQIGYGPQFLWPEVLPDNVMLAEVLRAGGYRTVASIGTSYFRNLPGFLQGFTDVWQARRYKPDRARAVSELLERLRKLEGSEQPWFAWVHLFNVHEPYLHDRRASLFGSERVDHYDTEVKLADRQIGRVLDWLRDSGFDANTVVVLASDHGEAFYEHGTYGHSYTLYDEELRSVLMARVPGVAAGVVEAPVGLMDLTPTLINLARLELAAPMPARSLVKLIKDRSQRFAGRPLIAELLPDGSLPYDQKAIRLDGWKLLYWLRDDSYQLYHVAEDAGEQVDLADSRPAKAEHLLGLLRLWISQRSRPQHERARIIARNRRQQVPEELAQRLEIPVEGIFTLVGYDMRRRRFRPGERMTIDFYYRVHQRTRMDLFFELSFDGPPEYRVPHYLHGHHYPLNGTYRTYEWEAGELLRDRVKITVPEHTKPASLRMKLRIRTRGEHGRILHLPGNIGGWLPLGEITIGR